MSETPFVVIGAGPAGLAAAHESARQGRRAVVLEAEDQVGGLSKTLTYKGFHFDVGGHRFFTKVQEVEDLWKATLGEDFLQRQRMSRIFYRDQFFRYPLHMGDAMFGLGFWQGVAVFFSFLKAQFSSKANEATFEDWVTNRFGKALFSIFFKSYTEKVWGISCGKLSADWAAQRIRDLNLTRAALNAMGLYRGRDSHTLADHFLYPRFGPGQMYEAMANNAKAAGCRVLTGHEVTSVRHESGRIVAVQVASADGTTEIAGDYVLSSMPIDDLIHRLRPAPPEAVVAAARGLRYRAILTANVIVERPFICEDNWVYLHAPEIRAGRMQVYKNWSPDLVPDDAFSSLGLEYFANEGEALWGLSDDQLVDVARTDLDRLGLAERSSVVDGCAVRYPKAYPVYDLGYEKRLGILKDYLTQFVNLGCIGRAGQFRYNNMDHSILTGLAAVRHFLGADVNPWQVNIEKSYLE